jgi:hypothetical protein
MTKNFDSIDEVLNVESSIVEAEPAEVKEVEIVSNGEKSKDIESDYKFARATLNNLIQKGQEAVDGSLELAAETDSPRAYEVTGQLIKNIADVVDKLMDLQKDVKDLETDGGKKAPTSVTNNSVFVGSTSQLLKALNLNNRGDEK